VCVCVCVCVWCRHVIRMWLEARIGCRLPSLVTLYLFFETVLLAICTTAHYIDKTGLELKRSICFWLPMLALKACATASRLFWFFFFFETVFLCNPGTGLELREIYLPHQIHLSPNVLRQNDFYLCWPASKLQSSQTLTATPSVNSSASCNDIVSSLACLLFFSPSVNYLEEI